jgi:small subunit ribosomal protein S35
MVPTQNWESVWPTIRTFHPAVVPLPVRQGFISNKRKQVHPAKYGNVELMKVRTEVCAKVHCNEEQGIVPSFQIPNFLHLTPPVVKKHADLIKRFCTPWPKGIAI